MSDQLRPVDTVPAPISTAAQARTKTSHRNPLLITGAVGLGVGVAALAGGLAANLLRNQAANDWYVCAAPDATCADKKSAIYSRNDLMIAGYVTGGVIAGASTILLGIGLRQERSGTGRVSLLPGPGQLGVACGGTF